MPYPAVQNSYLTLHEIVQSLSSLATDCLIKELDAEAQRGSRLDRRTEDAFLRIADIARELHKDGSWRAYRALPEALADRKAKVAVLARLDDEPGTKRSDRIDIASCRSCARE